MTPATLTSGTTKPLGAVDVAGLAHIIGGLLGLTMRVGSAKTDDFTHWR
jgi:hypothetical protein